jgi:DNA adenine methylase
LPEKHRFIEASKALSDAVLVTSDFEDTCRNAKAGDVVYFDPPYTVAHNNNGFIKYNARLFSWADQVRLSQFTRRLVNRNVTVVMTNADHASIRELYRGYNLHQIARHSSLSASPVGRKKVSELLITSAY